MFEGLLQPTHILLIVIVFLLLFGPKKLPELGAGLGKGIREFKNALSGELNKSSSSSSPSENSNSAAEDHEPRDITTIR